MRQRNSVLISEFKRSEGWQEIISGNLVELRGIDDRVSGEIIDEKIQIKGNGRVAAYLERREQRAKLPLNCAGKLMEGDKVWLLDEEGEEEFISGKRNNFEGAAIKIEMEREIDEDRKDIFIQEKTNVLERKNPKFNIILGAIVLLLLAGGTVLGYQKRTESEQDKEFKKIQENYAEKKKEIDSVRTMNLDTALQVAQEAESILNKAGKAEKKYASELDKMRQEIAEIKSALGGGGIDYEIAYDTNLIGENLNFKKMAVKKGILYLWSPITGRVEAVDVKLKSKENQINDEKVKNWSGIFCGGERCYGYDKNAIYEIKRQELGESKIQGLEKASEIEAWNSLIYYIDNSEQEIKKIVNDKGQNWLKEGLKLEEESSGISIDSSIWILGKSGKIYHYNRGEKENFSMSFQVKSEASRIIRTNEEVNFLAYIADEKSVIICGKDGKILARYNFDSSKVVDIAVESQEQAVLVLAENGKIYRIKIR